VIAVAVGIGIGIAIAIAVAVAIRTLMPLYWFVDEYKYGDCMVKVIPCDH